MRRHSTIHRLVRLIGSTDQQLVDTYHDKIRETTLDEMSDRQRQRRHLQLAKPSRRKKGWSRMTRMASLSASSTPGEYDAEVSPRVFDLAHPRPRIVVHLSTNCWLPNNH